MQLVVRGFLFNILYLGGCMYSDPLTMRVVIDGETVMVPVQNRLWTAEFIRPKRAKRVSIPLPIDFEEVVSGPDPVILRHRQYIAEYGRHIPQKKVLPVEGKRNKRTNSK